MLVPTTVEELNEADTALCQTTGQQAVVGIRPGLFRIGAVELEYMLGFAGEVCKLGDGRLHPVGHLILLDPGRDLRVPEFLQLQLVEPVQIVQKAAPGRSAQTRRNSTDTTPGRRSSGI